MAREWAAWTGRRGLGAGGVARHRRRGPRSRTAWTGPRGPGAKGMDGGEGDGVSCTGSGSSGEEAGSDGPCPGAGGGAWWPRATPSHVAWFGPAERRTDGSHSPLCFWRLRRALISFEGQWEKGSNFFIFFFKSGLRFAAQSYFLNVAAGLLRFLASFLCVCKLQRLLSSQRACKPEARLLAGERQSWALSPGGVGCPPRAPVRPDHFLAPSVSAPFPYQAWLACVASTPPSIVVWKQNIRNGRE